MQKFMKPFFLVYLILFFICGRSYAQLDSITSMNLPCNCGIGVTSMAATNAIPNATYYEWSTLPISVNSVAFNGQPPGSVQTSVPSVSLTCILPSQFVVICVTAYSASDSSNTFCDTIYNAQAAVFSNLNSSVASPNSSSLYFADTTDCPPFQYIWTLVGDITFDNGLPGTFTTDPFVNLNFGAGFTGGFLCVQTLSTFGFLSDTVCIQIDATVGLNDLHDSNILLYYQPALKQLTLEFHKYVSQTFNLNFYDITGKRIHHEALHPATSQHKFEISTPELIPGIYFVELTGIGSHKFFKFAVTE